MRSSPRLAPTLILCLGPALLVGCNSGSRDEPRAGTAAGVNSNTAPVSTAAGTPAAPAPASPAPSGSARLTLQDPGVQTGLQLLRGEISPEQAATSWALAGVSPAQAQDLLGRLPLTPALPAGTHPAVATISDGYGRSTDVSLFVPATPPPAEGYPVVVFLHGLGGDSSNMQSAAVVQNAIVIAPTAQDPPAGVTFEDEAPIPLGSAFPHWWVYRDDAFALRALDWVRERYAVDSDRVVLFGASMGGFGTWNVGLRFHDRFAKLVSAAGGISRLEFALSDPLSRSLLVNATMVPVWFAHGDADTVVPVSHSQTIASDLTQLAIPFTYRELPGAGHDTAAFTQLFGEVKGQVDTALRDPSPSQIVHRAIGNYHLGAYWVELKGPKGAVSARAQGQTITVRTSEGATGATVYLDTSLVDVSQPVTVVVDGATILSETPTASLAAVAASFARTRDPKLTYRFSVTTP